MSRWHSFDDDIYVPLDEAKSCAGGQLELCNTCWPEALKRHLTRPTAILARQVASPNYEMLWFTRLARRHGFHALVIEHASDRFTVRNPAKHALIQLPIVTGRSRNGQPIIRRQRIVEPGAAKGQPLEEIIVATGESLIAYHHRKLAEVLGDDAPEVIELRDIFPSGASGPAKYYLEFFKMLWGRLVLFEDFVVDNQTATFFQRTVMPAWRQAVFETGRRPQIARLGPDRRTSSPMWSAYPAVVADNPGWHQRPYVFSRSALLATQVYRPRE